MATKQALISSSSDQAAVPGEELTVHEYCIRRSSSDRRPELITAFAAVMGAAGVVKDTEAGLDGRFTDFINQPA